ncbi:MAG: polysaccharide biosynthesis protein [Firmicutes bacterium]|nr:polysaccharide biosynthesis protein [Bacillota bacterium]
MFYFKNKRIRTIIMMICDAVIAILGALLALALRFDITHIGGNYLTTTLIMSPVYIVITIAVLWISKLYNRVWSYASTKEVIDIIRASLIIEALILAAHVLASQEMPRSFYPLQFLALTGMLLVMRFYALIVRSVKGTFTKENVDRRIMLVGAGSAADVIIKELHKPNTKARIVCAIDDNINKQNHSIDGVPIVGTREDIKKNVETYEVSEIIIAIPSAPSNEIKEIIQICQETRVPVSILPSIAKTLASPSSIMGKLRPVSYEDLLGRDPVKVDQSGISDFIYGKVVMVTGGGGSIGSELCRQIIECNPSKLIIFDIYENNAYAIEQELKYKHHHADISTLIGSVRDYDRLEFVFEKYRPNIVFHAAAHKHVPLMEKSPNEAVKNNCLGTFNVAKLADKYEAENFTLISTDKAVRPTNIMGATKRICEMIVQVYARKSKNTRYSAVRFGNVLGSNGSVIPLFNKQIDEGGPVTVTHPEVRRFFMTIPEAVSLVLQASLYAEGGEIFILDMGEPVRIYDLAENLIRSRGLVPHEDIEIEIVGLRPGEKLYEEVLMSEEGLNSTANHKIFIGKPIEMDDEKFLRDLDDLIAEAEKNGTKIKEKTEEVCGTYTITDNEDGGI